MMPLCADHGVIGSISAEQGGPEGFSRRSGPPGASVSAGMGLPRSARPIPEDAKQPAYSAEPIKHLSSKFARACARRAPQPKGDGTAQEAPARPSGRLGLRQAGYNERLSE
jgi:hypothetical protein